MGATEMLELGCGGRRLAVPVGWEPVELRPDAARPDLDLAAGVVESSDRMAFAANVLISPAVPTDVDARELGVHQVVTDVEPGAPVSRIVVAVGDVRGWSAVTAHLFLDFGERKLLMVATVPTDRFSEVWPSTAAVVASVFNPSETRLLDGVLW